MKKSDEEDFLDGAVQVYQPADCLPLQQAKQGKAMAKLTWQMGIIDDYLPLSTRLHLLR
ncbi:MAG: hypothetical protein ABIG94_09625 [Pseudomonadota bacterium]